MERNSIYLCTRFDNKAVLLKARKIYRSDCQSLLKRREKLIKKADELFGKEVMKFYLCPPLKSESLTKDRFIEIMRERTGG